jgi:hypothetical protein
MIFATEEPQHAKLSSTSAYTEAKNRARRERINGRKLAGRGQWAQWSPLQE